MASTSETGSVRLWRLVKKKYATAAFTGGGAFRHGGRWNSRGHYMVYASEHLSLALLEWIIHLDPSRRIPELVAISIDVSAADINSVKLTTIKASSSIQFPWSLSDTREKGDDWVKAASSAILRVPSVIVPVEYNLLINPTHPAFTSYAIGKPQPFRIDNRYFV